MELMDIYQKMLDRYGRQGWWPTRSRGRYMKRWEVCVGAILTQNTSWKNAEKALDSMVAADCLGAEKIAGIKIRKLENLVKPSGFYRQKAKRLKTFSGYVLDNHGSVGSFLRKAERDKLLAISGIGPETADSILLYAYSKAHFVVDAYTRRIFSRLGFIDGSLGYEEIKRFFESNLPDSLEVYREFHALIVEHAKQHCRKEPVCEGCIMAGECNL